MLTPGDIEGKLRQVKPLHAYFEVDYETIWRIASEQLKQNHVDLKELMDKEFPDFNHKK